MRQHARKFLAGISLLALAAVCLAQAPAAPRGAAPGRVSITILGTTDIHGNLMPVDYYANRPAERGLAKIAALIRKVRAEQPNTLLIDSGDTIQGTPLAYFYARKETRAPNPTVAVMNALRYDAMAVGNHEFNFGLAVLWKAKQEAKFPWLMANVKQEYKDAVRRFTPYVIRNVGGVRVGIIGFCTPSIPRWEIPAHYKGYVFEDIVAAAQSVVPEVRRKADLVVVTMHSGLDRDPQSGEIAADEIPGENSAYALAEKVPGIDVIFYGHTHREMPELKIGTVILTQARNWGQSLARADIELERDAKGGWRVAGKRSTTIPVTNVAPDEEIVALAKSAHEATQAYLDLPVATSEKAMDGSTARYEDSPLVDLIHKVQLEYGQADVSLATMLFAGAKVPQGEVTIRQLAALYLYENTLYTVEMNGKQLREILEHAASYYPAWPFAAGERIRLPGYNADCAEGVSYQVDLRKPAGQRILNLTYKGAPLRDDQPLRVATNNYRYAGGGRYATYKGLNIVYRSPLEIRELLIEYAGRNKTIPTAANRNWEIVPREAFTAIVEEVRRLESRPGPSR